MVAAHRRAAFVRELVSLKAVAFNALRALSRGDESAARDYGDGYRQGRSLDEYYYGDLRDDLVTCGVGSKTLRLFDREV
jgi:hypothetical protein